MDQNAQPKTREELYQQLRETSREELIYSEMVRFGFWDEGEEQPTLPQQLLKDKFALEKELRELLARERKLDNPEKLIAEYRKQRMKESREKQQENREQREKERQEKVAAWKARKQKEILYLGEEVSGGLHQKESQPEKLAKYGLLDYADAEALATAMGITVGQLSFLSYNRRVSKVSHYKRFYMPKKSGGQRLISAPMPRLKAAQYWILNNILYKVPTHQAACGFKPNTSILTNAEPHQNQDVVVNMDFKDFFPTVTFRRIKGVFKNLGYSEHIATILAAICTEPDVDEVVLDGITYYTAKGERHLPQGAPTSPALTNILCYKLDARLAGMTKVLDFKYTRYADDLSFSASGEAVENLKKLLWRVRETVKDEGFKLHPDKTRIMRKGARQEVTGIVVNNQLGIHKKTLKKFRALLHQVRLNGWEGKRWGNSNDVVAAVWGYANFVAMVKPKQGEQFLTEVKALLKLHQRKPLQQKSNSKINQQIKEEQTKNQEKPKSKDKGKPRWKLW